MKKLFDWFRWGPNINKYQHYNDDFTTWQKAMNHWRWFNTIFYPTIGIAVIVGLIWWLSFVTVFFVLLGLTLTFGWYASDSLGAGITMNIIMLFVVLLGLVAVGTDINNYNQGVIPYDFADKFGLAGMIYYGFIAVELIIIALAILFLVISGVVWVLRWMTGTLPKKAEDAN